MFVAVAAMTFTACEKDNAENNNNNGTEQKTAITFNAEFADTRSYFTENNGEGYASAWTEGDEAIFTHTSYCYNDGATTVANTQSGGSAKFEVVFNVQGPNKNATIVAVSPASAWKAEQVYDWNVSFTPIAWKHTYAIPATQTPSATSVDEAAHIIKAETTYTGDNNISLTFEHQVAYGKLSLTDFDVTGATAVVLNINGATYTINPEKINILTDPIWFACEQGDVTEMSVKVRTEEKEYTKTLDFSTNSLSFVNGQVSKFSVSMADATTGDDGGNEDTPFEADYIYDTLTWNSMYSRFELTDNTGTNSVTQFYVNTNDRPNNNSIIAKTYTYAGNTESNPAEGTFSLRFVLGSGSGSSHGVGTTSDAATMDVTYNNGAYTIIITINNAANASIVGKTFGYKGMPEGWEAPAGGGEEPEPVQLATPENVKCAISGANVIITWDAVANASSYNVTLGEQTKSVNTTTATFENVAAGTYNVKVVAVGTGNYTNSEAANATVTVEAAGDGGGDEPIVYDPWECQKIGNYSGSYMGYTVTVQGTGSNTDTIVLSGLMVGNAPQNITATKDGVPGEGKGYIDGNNYHVVFDVTIGNVTYRGTTSNSIIE